MSEKPSFLRRVTRYLVEILIIIIGITISFALDDWDKRNTDQEDYKNYLINLQQDIQIDSSQMITDARSYVQKMNAVDLILRFDEKNYNQDTLIALGNGLNRITNFVEFLPNDNTFQMLSSIGGFRVFENQKLSSELIQLYKYDYAFIDMMGRESNDFRKSQLMPYLLENIYFEDQETFPVVQTDIPKVVGDKIFRNICIEYSGTSYSAYNSYRRALKRLIIVDKLIKEELDKVKG